MIIDHVYQQIPNISAHRRICTDRRVFQTLPCVSVWALGEERETMIIVANHSHICWAREHYGQSAVFKNPLNSAQMLAGNGRF